MSDITHLGNGSEGYDKKERRYSAGGHEDLTRWRW